MFKILIADDEKFIRRGIRAILTRDLEQEIACVEAENGLQALEAVAAEGPDLIITDISMPGLDGLEFISRLKEENDSIEVIILSGYENFDYAKKAMKLGVKDYVMKPIKKPEFLALIEEYIQGIQKGRINAKEAVKNSIKTNRILEQVKRETLLSLFQCKSSNEAKVHIDKLGDLGITFQSSLYVCVMIHYQMNDQNREYMDFVAKNIIDEYFSSREEAHSFITVGYEAGKTVLLFEGINQATFWEEQKYKLKECAVLIEKFGKTKVFIGIGDIAYDMRYLHNSLRHAAKAAGFKIYGREELVCCYEETDRGQEYQIPEAAELLQKANFNTAAVLNEFEFFLKEPESRQAVEAIDKLYSGIKQYVEKRTGIFKAVGNISTHPVMKSFAGLFSPVEMKKEIKKGIVFLNGQGQEKELEYNNVKLMEDIIYYIESHITEDLDLNTIAERFSRTSGYISTLFRKTAGIGFNEYITGERIRIAQQLLPDRSLSIQEIAGLCGYPNAKYFSVVFKKVAGCSPKQYRERQRD